jgi:anti-sigma regulatory factor (Ser/Thr protein kinase)
MRSGAAAAHAGYYHETAFYGSDDELVDIVRPFVRDGVAAREPTIVTFGDRNAAIVRRALGDTTGVMFLPGADQYSRPATTIRSYRAMFASLVASGATQIRVVGDVPHPGTGHSWHGWARYEAAVNHAYDEFPVWGMCPYDLRCTPAEVLEDVRRTHPHVAAAAGGHRVNDDFVSPESFLGALEPSPSQVEQRAPDIFLGDPSPAAARRAAASMAAAARLLPQDAADLELSLSELVTNAQTHGAPPCTVLLWCDDRRVVARVDDSGTGPRHPLAGLMPVGGPGGLGLWIVHQACRDVRMRRHAAGFSVLIEVGPAR